MMGTGNRSIYRPAGLGLGWCERVDAWGDFINKYTLGRGLRPPPSGLFMRYYSKWFTFLIEIIFFLNKADSTALYCIMILSSL
jgi:hypothetical protein